MTRPAHYRKLRAETRRVRDLLAAKEADLKDTRDRLQDAVALASCLSAGDVRVDGLKIRVEFVTREKTWRIEKRIAEMVIANSSANSSYPDEAARIEVRRSIDETRDAMLNELPAVHGLFRRVDRPPFAGWP